MLKTILAMIGLATLAYWLLGAQTATCVWCPTFTCFARCSTDCACVSKDYSGGTCYSFQLIDSLEGDFIILE